MKILAIILAATLVLTILPPSGLRGFDRAARF
jgi:hypothetical protein